MCDVDKKLIKEAIKEMIRDGEIEVMWDNPFGELDCSHFKIEDYGDAEGFLQTVDVRLAADDD